MRIRQLQVFFVPYLTNASNRRNQIADPDAPKSKWGFPLLFASDMNIGFQIMRSLTTQTKQRKAILQADAFEKAFPGCVWKRNTFSDNRIIWEAMKTTEAFQACVAAGRTDAGLWQRVVKLSKMQTKVKVEANQQ